MRKKATKIVSTIGPSSLHPTIIRQLIQNGVDVFRFNMKHNTVDWHEEGIALVQKTADDLNVPIGILIDLQGPEIRIKMNGDVRIQAGDTIDVLKNIKDKDGVFGVEHDSFFEVLKKGDKFSIDDGFNRFEIIKKIPGGFRVLSKDSGVLKTNKGLNLVKKDIPLPSLIEDDIAKLDMVTRTRVDYIALSFVRSKEDIESLREVMNKKKIDAQIVSKIESQKGIDNIDEIIEATDCVMIARGDLGIEVPIEQLAFLQKDMIDKCRKCHKPVIVATQMLQSMVDNPLPTRAEATDVANAVFDGTDAVMLSQETAVGKYPVRAVQAMHDIAVYNEEKATVTNFKLNPQNPTEMIVDAAESIAASAEKLKVDYIVVFTETGYTARVVSSFRPKIPILAVTHEQKSIEMLTMSYGITPVKLRFAKGKLLYPESVLKQLKKKGFVKSGELTLLIHGQHWKVPGQTNAIVLLRVK